MTLATGQVLIFLSKSLTRSQTLTSTTIYMMRMIENRHPKNTFPLHIMIIYRHQKTSNCHQKMFCLLMIDWNHLLDFLRVLKQMEISLKMRNNLEMLYHPQHFPLSKSVLTLASVLVIIVLRDASFTTSFHQWMIRSVATHGQQ